MTEEERREAEQLVRRMIELIGDDPDREGLVETPRRVVRSWDEIFIGYRLDIKKEVKVFSENYDQVVVVKEIDFYSMCEHHMLPFFGKVNVAYLPGQSGNVLGLSKVVRIVNSCSRRLQLQERMTEEIARVIDENIDSKGVAVVVVARHLCMIARGVKNANSKAVTSYLTGCFRDDLRSRNEVMRLLEV